MNICMTPAQDPNTNGVLSIVDVNHRQTITSSINIVIATTTTLVSQEQPGAARRIPEQPGAARSAAKVTIWCGSGEHL
jgi:hypothetical protein